MMRSSDRRIESVPFVVIAIVNAFVLAATLLLWMLEVLPLVGMVGVLLVLMVVEVIVIVLLQRRASRRQARAHEQSARGDVSTLDDQGPSSRYGYDPMDGMEGGGRR